VFRFGTGEGETLERGIFGLNKRSVDEVKKEPIAH
jgi:hypothetical protein